MAARRRPALLALAVALAVALAAPARTVAALELLVAVPRVDFDPTEVAVPWSFLVAAGHRVHFATPDGAPARADPIMLTGEGLGLFGYFLRAGSQAIDAYARLERDSLFRAPLKYDQLADTRQIDRFDGLLLPGGHAQGMREYLESSVLQGFVGEFFASGKPVAAVCHGVVLLARSKVPGSQRSSLDGRVTTALPAHMELAAEWLTNGWFVLAHTGKYYRTYPNTTVQDEVAAAVGPTGRFEVGPGPWSLDSLFRDSYDSASGFVVIDGAYVSARWPGDANTFAAKFDEVLGNYYASKHMRMEIIGEDDFYGHDDDDDDGDVHAQHETAGDSGGEP